MHDYWGNGLQQTKVSRGKRSVRMSHSIKSLTAVLINAMHSRVSCLLCCVIFGSSLCIMKFLLPVYKCWNLVNLAKVYLTVIPALHLDNLFPQPTNDSLGERLSDSTWLRNTREKRRRATDNDFVMDQQEGFSWSCWYYKYNSAPWA
jgi:hypothetical protein